MINEVEAKNAFPISVFSDYKKSATPEIVDLNQQMYLEIIDKNNKKSCVCCGEILRSTTIVKFVQKNNPFYGIFKAAEKLALKGLEFENVESVKFLLINDPPNWTIKNDNECVFTWIRAPDIFLIILRIEKDGDNLIVYYFMPHTLRLKKIT